MVLCPGQGAQYTGMFAETMTNSTTEKLVQQSIGILGYDIRMVANNGSKDVLDRYKYFIKFINKRIVFLILKNTV